MKNKKISKLVDPSFRLYFLVGFLFAAVTVRVSIPLAICEAAAMAFLWWYFRHTAQKRREGIRQYIDDVTDDMTTADKASMLSAPFAMMVFRPDTQEILWSTTASCSSLACARISLTTASTIFSPIFRHTGCSRVKASAPKRW